MERTPPPEQPDDVTPPDERSAVDASQTERAAEQGQSAEHAPDPPRIWVGSLRDNNRGQLYGEWLDAAQSPEELAEALDALLGRAPSLDAEEWAIFDYNGFGAVSLQLGPYEPLERISIIARGIAEQGPAFAAYVNSLGVFLVNEETIERFRDRYLGDWPSLRAYAEHQLEELGTIEQLSQVIDEHLPQLRQNISVDLDRYAADMALTLDVIQHENGIWLFDLNE